MQHVPRPVPLQYRTSYSRSLSYTTHVPVTFQAFRTFPKTSIFLGMHIVHLNRSERDGTVVECRSEGISILRHFQKRQTGTSPKKNHAFRNRSQGLFGSQHAVSTRPGTCWEWSFSWWERKLFQSVGGEMLLWAAPKHQKLFVTALFDSIESSSRNAMHRKTAAYCSGLLGYVSCIFVIGAKNSTTAVMS